MTDNSQTTTLSPAEQQRLVQAVYAEIAQMIKNGQSAFRFQQSLVERGLQLEDARAIVNQLQEAENKVHRDEATKQMAIGAVICIIGIAVTWGTFSAATGGGAYVVAWGAIIFGGWRFLRGMMMMGSN